MKSAGTLCLCLRLIGALLIAESIETFLQLFVLCGCMILIVLVLRDLLAFRGRYSLTHTRISSIVIVRHAVSADLLLLLLLPSGVWFAELCQDHTAEGSPEVPERNNDCSDAPRRKELEELIDLIQIVL